MVAKCILWVKTRPGYGPLFSILDGSHLDNEQRYWIVEHVEIERSISDIDADTGQMGTGVEILPPIPQHLENRQGGVYTMMDKRFKSEIAQRELSNRDRRSIPF